MIVEHMTAEERLRALLKGEALDRVPVIPFIFGHVAVVNGISIGEFYENAETSFHAQIRAAEMYGYEPWTMYGYASFGAWEFGGEVQFPHGDGEAPEILRHPATTPEEALALTVPDDIMSAGSMPIYWQFSKLQAEHGCPITLPGGGAFTGAAGLAGVENLMMWMVEAPEAVHHLCRVMTDFLLEACDIWVDEYGADNLVPFCGHALESNMLISPQNFKTFSLPYITEMVGKFAETGIANSYIHICSEQIKNLPFYAQVAWPRRTIVTFGIEMPTMTVAEHFPGHVICGPLDPLLIRSGTADEVLTQGKERIEEGKAVPGFALASGCDIPAYSPPINVYQMVKAAKLYGVH